MSDMQTERVRLLIAITVRGHGRRLIEWMRGKGIGYQLSFTGHGTASSEMMDVLGLGDSKKDIVVSLGKQSAVESVVRAFSNDLDAVERRGGIMMLFSPAAVGNLIATILSMYNSETMEKDSGNMMKNEHQHSLILIAVNQGYTDLVMQTARRAGATGGTIVRARLAGAEAEAQIHGIALQSEKEIVAILAADSIRDDVLNEVNLACGFRTEAQGVLCALPVDKAFKI